MKRRVLVLVLAVAAWVSGCANDAADLAPFPCAMDGTCPAGLACLPGVGCTQPVLGARCEETCAVPGATCNYGLCAAYCDRSTTCPGTQACVPASATDLSSGVCLDDCATSDCPEGLTCADFGNRVQACVASGPVPGDANSKSRTGSN